MAIIAPAFALSCPVQAHYDCLGVVRLHNQTQDQVGRSRSKYAGLRLGLHELAGAPMVAPAHHIPAHRSLEIIDAQPFDQRRIARANHAADLCAKNAA
eukprot:4845113-Pyramimonas_sp.AAC.1